MTTPAQGSPSITIKEDRLPFLDGLRGLAAVWVIADHSLYLAGTHIKYISRGDIAVDLFMILSGFLMTYHYYLREEKEPWGRPSTWIKFYIRRFFRIAPLYYFLLVFFFLIGTQMAAWRMGLAYHFNDTYTDPVRFLDRSWQNILMHVTFLYGLSKDYVTRTTMPDWSITLEMQFYWAFPFLMLLFRRFYFVLAVPLLYALCYKCNAFLYHDGYMKPSVLPMSMMYFMMGILLALFNRFRDDPIKAACALGLTFWLAWTTQEKFVMALALLLMMLLNPRTVGKPMQPFSRMLSGRFAAWLADMSYPAYLIHMGLMMPIAFLCAQEAGYRALPGPARFAVIFILTVIPTYAIAMVLYHTIEKNGILWGKRIIKSLGLSANKVLSAGVGVRPAKTLRNGEVCR